MKKALALILVLMMAMTMFVACQNDDNEGSNGDESAYKVAMVTDYGDITDQSFNQATYEGCTEFCTANSIEFKYFKPTGDSTAERVAQVEAAIDEGFNVVVMPGFAFAGTIYEVQDKYPDVKFIALDVAEFDIFDAFYNHDETGAQTDLIDPENEPHIADNVYSAVYQEELSGYMAGYAAVKLGYKHLGFLGGMAVPAVIRYGYGFVQGCDAAAAEMSISDQVTVEYVYGNLFNGAPEITAYMDTWYQEKGVEVVFACGGGIFTSAVEAAVKGTGKVIGVDVDQAANISAMANGADITVTSAMKGLSATVIATLTDVIVEGNWANYGGKIANLGLVSGEDPELNYVQIPFESTQWADSFTQEDYKALVADMFNGTITVSNATDAMPAVTITVNEYGNIM